jgi:ATP-dependent RNA helicase RhlE
MNPSIVDARPTPSDDAPMPGSPFAALGLSLPLVRAIVDEGYACPTPIQSRAIPSVLGGADLLACAQTGTGKTAAFMLPLLQRLGASATSARRPASRVVLRALVLSPTRELAAQIGERTAAYGRHVGVRHTVIYGGVSQKKQEEELRRGVDLVIATPGRLIDLMGQGVLALDDVELLVLDEADRMLDMGFLPDVRRLLARMPRRGQTLFFSATMPREIRRLADDILRSPAQIEVAPEVTAAPSVSHAVWHVPHADKRGLIERVLASDAGGRRAIVFTRTKRGANRVCDNLVRAGFCAGVIHGNKSQNARERVLDAFREGTTRVLVATDIAARGIDVEDVGLVVNYDLPNEAESYVHRIGRTGRAGNEGAAVSFCDREERPLLAGIERLLRFRIPVVTGSLDGASPAQPTASTPAHTPARPVAPPAMPGESTRTRRPRRYRGARSYR